MRAVAARAVAVLSFFCAVPALAELPSDALKRAVEDYAQGEWDRVVERLSKVAAGIKDAATRAAAFKLVGLAEVERKRPADAEVAFVQALSADPLVDVDPVEHPPAAVNLFRAVRDRLDGRLLVSADQPGARVFVDGIDQGLAPFDGRAKIGRRRVRVVTEGGRFARELNDVLVRVGGVVRLVIKLEARPARVTDRPGATVTTRPGAELTTVLLKPLPPRRTRPWAWAALGVGVTSLVVGAILFATPEPAWSSREQYASDLGGFNNRVNAGSGLLVSGALSSAASVVLFLLHRDGPNGGALK